MARLSKLILLLSLIVFSIAGCGSSPPTASFHINPTPTPSPPLATSPSDPHDFTCETKIGGPNTPSSAPASILSSITAAHSPSYDRLTFTFSGPNFPHFSLATQPDSIFYGDNTGLPVILAGNAGLLLTLSPALANDPSAIPPISFPGSTDILPKLSALNEVRLIGDYQHVLSFGLGLASPVCFAVQTLASPFRLVIDFQTTA